MTFEDAVRKRLNLQGEYHVSINPSGGGQFQIGDYTWDSEPYTFELTVSPIITETVKRKAPSLFHGGYAAWERGETVEAEQPTYTKHRIPRPDPERPSYSKEFDSVPAIWAWLEGADDE